MSAGVRRARGIMHFGCRVIQSFSSFLIFLLLFFSCFLLVWLSGGGLYLKTHASSLNYAGCVLTSSIFFFFFFGLAELTE